MKLIDLTGKIFGKLRVVSFAGRFARGKYYAYLWNCECQCGNSKAISQTTIAHGAKSCGCNKTKHGRFNTPEYWSWVGMKSRVLDPNRIAYKDYGGRGIKVCERWMEFSNFFEDMGDKPTPKHTLERVDNNGNYEPGNCIWETRRGQSNNRRDNVFIEANGKRLTITQWAREIGISRSAIRGRLESGESESDAVNNSRDRSRIRNPNGTFGVKRT